MQAEALKRHIGNQSEVRPDVVIVSPLTRALETAVGVFGGGLWHENDEAQPLMLSQEGIPVSLSLPADELIMVFIHVFSGILRG